MRAKEPKSSFVLEAVSYVIKVIPIKMKLWSTLFARLQPFPFQATAMRVHILLPAPPMWNVSERALACLPPSVVVMKYSAKVPLLAKIPKSEFVAEEVSRVKPKIIQGFAARQPFLWQMTDTEATMDIMAVTL